jgi:ABC-type branched-subunit amino acid transport system substrate-binding protein
MYREGILPSGEPMLSFVKGDLPVSGTAFTCESCHLRSGLGSFEGGVYTPATNGSKLFKPLEMTYIRFERPAYTDETLARALRGGVDPRGRVFEDAMPRYPLNDEDMAIMIFYLKSLSSEFSPGISETNIRFATVMTDDVSQQERDAMLLSLLSYFDTRNRWGNFIDQQRAFGGKYFSVMTDLMTTSYKQFLSLSSWLLKGPPETWRSQLEEYYRKDPVFALIGGITKGEWKPIHQFSEDNRIPCLFPNTDFPVISRTDWYTLYMSKGYYQEGEAAARYLNNSVERLKGRPVVQIVRDSREGKALQSGFQETWQDLGREAMVTITLKPGKELARGDVQKLLAKEKPGAIILWDGPAGLAELEMLAQETNRPEMVFVSSGYLGKDMWALKEQVRDFTYITYPTRLPESTQIKANPSRPSHAKKEGTSPLFAFSADITKESNQIFAIQQVLTMILMDMKQNYYRDNFLDVISMNTDIDVPLYEHISFGPGQRYASKGCYIVQLSKGEKPELVKKSDWVIR